MYAIFFQKQGFQGFKILYWLSSCDDKDKDKDKDKVKEKYKVLPRPNVCYFFSKAGDKYLSWVNIFQGLRFFMVEYFSVVNIFLE